MSSISTSFPWIRETDNFIGNNWWFVPTPDKSGSDNSTNVFRTESPLISYIKSISRTNAFYYMVIIIIIITFIYRLQLTSSIWIGLIVGIIAVYYINEKNRQELNDQSDRLLNILTSDLLKETKYFILDPRLIEWVNDVGELKKYNILTFNKMIAYIERMLKLEYTIDINNSNCSLVIKNISDLKRSAVNAFHSLIYVIDYPQLRHKYDHNMTQLDKLLNEHIEKSSKICYLYDRERETTYNSNPIRLRLEDPAFNDPTNNPHYDFFN